MMGAMTSAVPAIEVTGLSKAYGSQAALRGVDFTVARGEVFGLLGPNGAGKTTCVEVLEGYRERDSGEVRVLGCDPGARDLRARVGIVLQSCGTYPYLTVRETLAHWASLYPHPRRVDEVLALAGLDDCADRRARTLSGGQARRLDFALALVGDPELIFLDEPTTGFDPAARRAAWDVIRALQGTRQDGRADHALPRRGAGARRPRGDPPGRPDPRRRPAGLARRLALPRGLACRRRHARGALHRGPDRAAAPLTADALARGEKLEELSVTRPSLEDVYLELIEVAV